MNRLSVAALALLAFACGPRSTQAGNAAPAEKPASPVAAAPADPKAPVAKYNGGTITTSDLDDYVKSSAQKLEREHDQRMYELRKAGLDALLAQKLVEAKAKKEGLTPEALLKRDVQDKLPKPSDQEMKALYDQASAAGQQLPPYEQVKPQIATYIQNQRAQDAVRAYYDKLRAEAKAEVLLPAYQPPRVAVAAEGPAKGPADAPITIVEFSDFECPFCSKGEEVIQQVLAKYPGKIKLVYRDFPLPFHSHAQKAAEAAHCAGEQGKYWEMHGKLFANQKALDEASLKGYAKEIGVDEAKFGKCLASGEKAKDVEANKKAGEAVGVTGTPAFFVNGMLLNGAQPLDAFTALIDAELKNAVAKK